MNTALRDYPAGDLRASDADRDRALRELSDAFQAGRITADEFNQRSGQALVARTGKELAVLLADLPADRARTETAQWQAHRQLATRIVVGASGAAATSLAALATTNALSRSGPVHQNRKLAEEILAHMGLRISLPPAPPAPGFDWVGTIIPAAIAVLLVAVIVTVLRVARARRTDCVRKLRSFPRPRRLARSWAS
jgi:hypothetical protein